MIKQSVKNNLSFCFDRRNLLKQIVFSKLKLSRNDFFLGYLWWFLDPLILMAIYWILVVAIFKRGGPDYPLFVLIGLVPFRAIAVSINQAVTAISAKYSLVSQINFPRIFLPISDVIVNHIKLIAGFIVIFASCPIFGISIRLNFFLIIVPFILQLFLISGVSLICSVLGVFVKDTKNMVQFAIRILMYLSPVIYSIELIPPQYKNLYFLNPIAGIIVLYRDIIMYNATIKSGIIIICSIESILIFIIGYILFINKENFLLKYI